ncbi:protein FAM170B [Glossophaga mutica]
MKCHFMDHRGKQSPTDGATLSLASPESTEESVEGDKDSTQQSVSAFYIHLQTLQSVAMVWETEVIFQLVSRKPCIHEAKFIKKQSRKSFSFEMISNTDLCWDLESSKTNCCQEQNDLKPLGLQRAVYRSCVACCPGFPMPEVLLEQAH